MNILLLCRKYQPLNYTMEMMSITKNTVNCGLRIITTKDTAGEWQWILILATVAQPVWLRVRLRIIFLLLATMK